MTTQKTFKHRVRSRMAKTGESYTAARRMLIASGDRPEPPQTSFRPPMSDEALERATGAGWQHWFGLLDNWGAAARSHTATARWLVDEHGVPGWWAQSITVAYEQARGLRAPGQRPDGWSVSASKTIATSVQRLFQAFDDEATREGWLGQADLRLRTASAARSARYDWEDGTTRVNANFSELGERKSRVAVAHERLPDAETAEEMKTWWRERLGVLKQLLEAEDTSG